MTACGWPNLVRIADAALRHYDEICDAAYHYAPYVGASLGWPTPCFNHHRWDWIEVLPYPLIGRIAARRITGCRSRPPAYGDHNGTPFIDLRADQPLAQIGRGAARRFVGIVAYVEVILVKIKHH